MWPSGADSHVAQSFVEVQFDQLLTADIDSIQFLPAAGCVRPGWQSADLRALRKDRTLVNGHAGRCDGRGPDQYRVAHP